MSKKYFVSFLSWFLLGVLVLGATPVARAEDDPGRLGLASRDDVPHDPDAVLVKVRPGVASAQVAKEHHPLFGRWIRVPVPEGTAAAALERFARRPGVEVV